MIRHGLHCVIHRSRCTSNWSKNFHYHQFRSIQQGGVNSVKVLKILRENGKISNDYILMVNEMHLEKATQYHSGEYLGANDEGNLYKGIVAFMIVGLKDSIPYIVQAILEVKFSDE